MNNIIESLKNRAKALNVLDLANVVLDDPKFEIWSGSSKPDQHHYGNGGLLKHTEEVVDLCILNSTRLETGIDITELFLAALFHDIGKTYDYEEITEVKIDYVYEDIKDSNSVHDGSPAVDRPPFKNSYTVKKWQSTKHKRLIHHISRSALIWSKAVSNFPDLNDKYADSVLHCILSHHGQKEYGSPVTPFTKAAWLLHLSDSISARMSDCEINNIYK